MTDSDTDSSPNIRIRVPWLVGAEIVAVCLPGKEGIAATIVRRGRLQERETYCGSAKQVNPRGVAYDGSHSETTQMAREDSMRISVY